MKRIIKRSQEEEPRISPSVRKEIVEYLYRISKAMEVISEYLGAHGEKDALVFYIKVYPDIPEEVYEEFIKIFRDETRFIDYYFEILGFQLENFMFEIKTEYPWIVDWYQTGRAGGWLCIVPEKVGRLWDIEENVMEAKFESLDDYDLIYLLSFIDESFYDVGIFIYEDTQDYYLGLLERETVELENMARDVEEINKRIKEGIRYLESPEFWIEELKALKEE